MVALDPVNTTVSKENIKYIHPGTIFCKNSIPTGEAGVGLRVGLGVGLGVGFGVGGGVGGKNLLEPN
jgi:hypothetical protein